MELQIKQVGQLAGFVKFTVAGLPVSKLTDRMACYDVKSMRIAVVHYFKIVWAKGYGWADEKEQRPVTGDAFPTGLDQ